MSSALDDSFDYDSGYSEGKLDGYRDGYDEGKRDILRATLEELRRRELGSQLPTPIYCDVMSLQDVEKMIRRVVK